MVSSTTTLLTEEIEFMPAGTVVNGKLPPMTYKNFDDPIFKAFNWYQRLGCASRAVMRAKVADGSIYNITFDDIDLLPWNGSKKAHWTYEQDDIDYERRMEEERRRQRDIHRGLHGRLKKQQEMYEENERLAAEEAKRISQKEESMREEFAQLLREAENERLWREDEERSERRKAERLRLEEEERKRREADRLQREKEERKRREAEEAERLRREEEKRERQREQERLRKEEEAKRLRQEEERKRREEEEEHLRREAELLRKREEEEARMRREKEEQNERLRKQEKEANEAERNRLLEASLNKNDKISESISDILLGGNMLVKKQFLYDTRMLMAYQWWYRMQCPLKKEMLRRCKRGDMERADLYPDDVELLPWIESFSVNVPQMIKWIQDLDPRVTEVVDRLMLVVD